MKFVSLRKTKSESGSVLATTLVITFVIGATLASFLLLTRHQTFANARSQSWNEAMALAEAGIEDGMQMINYYNYDTTKLLDWPNVAAANGWTMITQDVYQVTRTLGNGTDLAYTVWITNRNPISPSLYAVGHRQYHFWYKPAPVSTAVIGAAFGGYETKDINRGVACTTIKDALWTLAMLADRGIDLNGNDISTDSFNSADTGASTYDAVKGFSTYALADRRDHGDVATNWRIINSLNVGNANIMGTVSTGPGGTVAIGPNGAVGDETWVLNNNGIQDGYSSDDMNVKLDPVGLPADFSGTSLPVEAGTGTEIDGVKYKHIITSGGDYEASTLSGSVFIASNVTDTVRIHLKDSVSLTGQEQIFIPETAGRLEIYMSGQEFKLGGGGVVNNTGKAENFLYFGLPTNTELKFGGNADFTGAIYAPNASFTLGGGGSTPYDFIGASVTRTVTMNGSYKFHYDEDLANLGPSIGFVITTWAEKN